MFDPFLNHNVSPVGNGSWQPWLSCGSVVAQLWLSWCEACFKHWCFKGSRTSANEILNWNENQPRGYYVILYVILCNTLRDASPLPCGLRTFCPTLSPFCLTRLWGIYGVCLVLQKKHLFVAWTWLPGTQNQVWLYVKRYSQLNLWHLKVPSVPPTWYTWRVDQPWEHGSPQQVSLPAVFDLPILHWMMQCTCNLYIYMYIYIYICTYIYTYIYIHIYIYPPSPAAQGGARKGKRVGCAIAISTKKSPSFTDMGICHWESGFGVAAVLGTVRCWAQCGNESASRIRKQNEQTRTASKSSILFWRVSELTSFTLFYSIKSSIDRIFAISQAST